MRSDKEIVDEWERSSLPSTNLILEVCLDIRNLLKLKEESAEWKN